MDFLHQLEGAAFGLADGVICALGMLIGVAAATSNPSSVIVVGIVGGVADAFGNSIGFYISQSTERGVQRHEERKGKAVRVHSRSEVLLNGVMSFVATVFIFALLVLPFVVVPIATAMYVSFVLGIFLLFVFGAYVARISQENWIKLGVEYALLGMVGAFLSWFVGLQLKM